MMDSNDELVSEKEAWGEMAHAEAFDYMHKEPDFILKKHYEGFHEGRLLKNNEHKIKGDNFFEIGCATGELFRYISKNISRFNYCGFDISGPAIKRAIKKYPQGNFYQILSGFDEIREKFGQPDVLWCRDVVLHQDSPYEFLKELINLSEEAVILRLRTRDEGATVFDKNISCQLHWNKSWVPYIVLNTDEMISRISEHSDVNKIIICRNYEVLGGHNYRYLPKELFFTNAGGAETGVYIQKGERSNGKVDVEYMDGPDRPRYRIRDRILKRIILLSGL